KSAPFFGKCVYCEKFLLSGQFGDIEHFRPKNKVTDANDHIVQVLVNGEVTPHPGYYWLAYDWRNLVPSCCLCNKINHRSEGSRLIGKGTRFPVAGQYASAPGEEANELPLLILPTLDDPTDHIEVTETGVLKWKTDRGKATISILGLNERSLPDERREIYRNTRLKVAALFYAGLNSDTETQNRFEAEFANVKAGKVEFSLVARQAMRDQRPVIEHQMKVVSLE
ncbi:MAG: hypothetical protein ACJ8FY_10005, partial [Gemmataceae bacterium]